MKSRTIVATLSLILIPCFSQAARQKNIESVTPRIGQRGTTVDVLFKGLSIDDPRQVIFENPGITVIDLKQIELEKPSQIAGGPRTDVTCKFVIAGDCPLGEHRFRLLTGTELSGLTTFHVGRFPCVDELEPRHQQTNGTLETAESIELNTTVRALMDSDSADDHDYYRVAVSEGQRLSVEVDSVRIADQNYGNSEFDLQVRILDSQGNEFAHNDDNDFALQDPVVSTIIDYSGFAYIEVSRSLFAPRDSMYCVHIGDFARPLLAFPPGGQAGETIEVQLIGDAAGDYRKEVTVPEGTSTFGVDVGANHPVRMRSCEYPSIMESNEGKPTVVESIPVALNGRLTTRGQYDDYRLSVVQGERYRFRVYAFSLGSSIDTVMQIHEIDGGQITEMVREEDDSTIPDRDIFGTRYRGGIGIGDIIDPTTIWKAKKTGDIIVRISDSSAHEGPGGIYRVEIEPVRTMVAPTLASSTFDGSESTRVTGLAIPKGNRWSVNITLPKGQFASPTKPFRLVAKGLPEGVEMISAPVIPESKLWPVLFKASPEAKLRATTFKIVAEYADSPHEPIESFNQHNVPFINHSGGNAWKRVTTESFFVGVTESPPFSIELAENEIQLLREATRKIPVKVTRHGDFKGPVLVNVGFVHEAIDTSPELVVSPDQSIVEIELTAGANTPLQTLPFVVTGSNTNEAFDPYLGIGHIRVSSNIAKLTVTQPYLRLTAEPQSIRRNGTGELTWDVQHLAPFQQHATLKLLGLPKGVTAASPVTVSAGQPQATFQLQATDEALIGNNLGIACEVTYKTGDAVIRQITGEASLRIDPSVKK